MADPRLAAIPKFLETPKDDSLEQDRKNLAALRRLAPPSSSDRVIPSEARDPSPPRGPG
jgi:hypothetical protein